MLARVLIVILAGSALLCAEPVALAPHAIVENYCVASRAQAGLLNGASMDVDIEASVPKLKKHGRLHALRRISALGRITYERLRFEGDGTVKNNVIARYLTAEAQAQTGEVPAVPVTPDNYKFKYKGLREEGSSAVHVFEVTPKKKRLGAFKGEIWIDGATYLRVRESGYLVKNPSIFLKRIAFVRKYEIRDGISVPLQVQSVVDTRLVGKAEVNIEFSNFLLDGKRAVTADDEGL